jgi:flagellar biosynthesis/type III secretory pathway protein FliH
MSSIKFETIRPDVQDSVDTAERMMKRLRTAFEEGRRRGFVEGTAASAEEHASAQDQLRSQFLEALNDQRLSHQEARSEVTRTILPAIQALVSKLAPSLARAGLPGIVDEVLTAALANAPASRPIIHCAPELADGLRNGLERHMDSFEISGDPRLTPLEARVSWDEGFTNIDLQSCVEAIEAGIVSLSQSLTINTETANVG